MTDKCELCGIETELTKHHCCPASKAKNKYKQIKEDESNIAWICRSCHDFVHATFDNNFLRDNLNSLDLLKSNEEVNNFVKWKQKHPDFKGHSKMSFERRSKQSR